MHASETDHTLSHELRAGELQAMADSHEAETFLFQYIIASSGLLETPPVILKKLADNLGDPQRLPAAKILQTAVLHPPVYSSAHSSADSSIYPSEPPSPHPLSHPLSTLIAMEGILENTFEDSAAAFEEELASSGRGDRSTPWISLENSEDEDALGNDIVFENEHIAEVSLQAKPLVERKKQRLFPAGKIFIIGLAIIYGYMVLKTGSLSPLAIFDTIKNQRQAPMQVESPLENWHPEEKQDAVSQPPRQEHRPLPHQKAYPGVVILPDALPSQKHDQTASEGSAQPSDQQQDAHYGQPSE